MEPRRGSICDRPSVNRQQRNNVASGADSLDAGTEPLRPGDNVNVVVSVGPIAVHVDQREGVAVGRWAMSISEHGVDQN